ncbi:MAG: DNA primase small subunit domain-containing protein [archaeon]|jgi:DNA primase small subunit
MYEAQASKEADFLKKAFGEYYKAHTIDSVSGVEFREFGFGLFKKKIANRNLAFENSAQMNSFLKSSAPLFFSYSNAYYKFPSRTPMQSKELLKADIIYEFDADELGLEVPQINGIQWFALEHLEEAKKQVFRLLDYIENDFNFSSEGLSINFSGKAGFHVHLRGKEIQDLKKKARIELVDYLTAQNIDYLNIGFDFDSLRAPRPLGLWQKRLLNGIKVFFEKNDKEIAKITGVTKKKINSLTQNKSAIINSLDKGVLMQIEAHKSDDFWKKILDNVVAKERIPIDRQTSIDLHKIIRVPQTLHGDTGFIAKVLLIDELKKFNPYNDAIVFDETFAKKFNLEKVSVQVIACPRFELLGQIFGPFENSLEELPLFAAVYLIGKGAAVLKE